MKKYTVFMHVELDVPGIDEHDAENNALCAIQVIDGCHATLSATKPILTEETED